MRPEALLEVRLDSPLRSGPVVKDERVLVLAADGRLVGMDLHPNLRRGQRGSLTAVSFLRIDDTATVTKPAP